MELVEDFLRWLHLYPALLFVQVNLGCSLQRLHRLALAECGTSGISGFSGSFLTDQRPTRSTSETQREKGDIARRTARNGGNGLFGLLGPESQSHEHGGRLERPPAPSEQREQQRCNLAGQAMQGHVKP